MTTRQQLANLRERITKLKAERAYWMDLAEERLGELQRWRAKYRPCGVRPGVRPWHNKRPRRKP